MAYPHCRVALLTHRTFFLLRFPFYVHFLLYLLLLPVASALQNITILNSDSSVNYQPGQGVWDPIGDSGASNGAYRLARTQDAVATISRTFRSLYFTSPLWPFPVEMTISVGSTKATIDLQDHSVAATTPPPTGLTPSSKSSQIRWSFHGPDGQRTVRVSASSSSTGWTAIVDSFIFETAQPGDPAVASSPSSGSPPSSPVQLPPPQSLPASPIAGGSNGNSGSPNLPNSPNSPSTSPSSGLSIPNVGNGLDISPTETTGGGIPPNPLPSGISTVSAAGSSGSNLPLGTSSPASFISGVPYSPDPSSNPLDPNGTSTPSGVSDDHKQKKPFPIGIIIGVICGFIFLLALVGWFVWYTWKRRRNMVGAHKGDLGEDSQQAKDTNGQEKGEEEQPENPFENTNVFESGEGDAWRTYNHPNRPSFSSSTSFYVAEPRPIHVQGPDDSAGTIPAAISATTHSSSAAAIDNSTITTTSRDNTSVSSTPISELHPRRFSYLDSGSIEMTDDLVPVRRQVDELGVPPQYNRSTPHGPSESPFLIPTNSPIPCVTPTKTPAPYYFNQMREQRSYQSDAGSDPEVRHHQSTPSHTSFVSTTARTPPPQYRSMASGAAWDELGFGLTNSMTTAHAMYLSQHGELMRSLEGAVSGMGSATNSETEAPMAMDSSTNRRHGNGGIPTPPPSDRRVRNSSSSFERLWGVERGLW